MTTNYGLDVSTVPDIASDAHVTSGPTLLAEALYNRYRTKRGTLADDLNYGRDLTQYLNDDVGPGDIGRITADIQSEALKDERVKSAAAAVTLDTSGNLDVVLSVTPAQGPTFTLVLKVTAVSLILLEGP